MAHRISTPKIPICALLILIWALWLPAPSAAAKQQLTIAMLLWRGETTAEKGFKQRLGELGYAVDYREFDLGQDLINLGRSLKQISADIEQYDYVYTFGTTVSRRAKLVIQQRVPQIFTAVSDPVGAGIVDSLEAPGEAIGGATDMVPLALQVQDMLEVIRIEKLGLLFNPREKNSMLIRGRLNQLAQQHGFIVVDFRCPPQGTFLEENLQQLIDSPGLVDAVFLPSDSYLGSRSDYIAGKLLEGGLAGFGSLREFIDSGLLMGIVIDYHELGRTVAGLLDRHRQQGSFDAIAVVRPEKYEWLVNTRTQRRLGITLPAELAARSRFLE